MIGSTVALLLMLAALQVEPPRAKAEEIHVFGDRLVLFLRYEVEAGPATTLRARFDSDGSGKLGADERQALADAVLRLATEDLRVEWDERPLAAAPILKAATGLDRRLASGDEMVLYWQLDFELPDWVPGARHELRFSDRAAGGRAPFGCRVRLAPGVESETAEPVTSFEFSGAQGSFRMGLLFQAAHDREGAREPRP